MSTYSSTNPAPTIVDSSKRTQYYDPVHGAFENAATTFSSSASELSKPQGVENPASDDTTPVHIRNAPIPCYPSTFTEHHRCPSALPNPTAVGTCLDTSVDCKHDTLASQLRHTIETVAYGEDADIFMVYGQHHPEAAMKYSPTEVQLMKGWTKQDRNIFLLFELYGVEFAERLLFTEGIALRQAHNHYRDLCKEMWRWHNSDKHALVLAMQDFESSRFSRVAQIMKDNYDCNHWSRERISSEYKQYLTYGVHYFEPGV